MEHRRHVVLVTFPTQGNINPSLEFSKKLVKMGVDVTFVTSAYAQRRMAKNTAGDAPPKGLTFAAFSDGFDDGFKISIDDREKHMAEIRNQGSKTLKDIILTSAEHNRPVTCLVYTLLLSWVSEVAREFHIPTSLLWIQPATVFNIYYYYFNGFGDEIIATSSDPSLKFNVPKTRLMLSKHDLPSFLIPTTSETDKFAIPGFKEQFEILDSEINPKVLVNTFDALEFDALKAIDKYKLIAIGPLIKDPFDNSFGGNLFKESDDDYIEWLNSKPKSSVVYVSFGSLLNLSKAQMEEIAKGLLECCRPFLWVIRAGEDDDEKLSCSKELEKIGKIVPWCSQLRVLTNPSLGCFVTHCGWNSTSESVSCGVPIVAFPHWSEQGTNAKLIEDVWRTGVRVSVKEEDGIVESGEIRRCIEEVMDGGEKSRELRENAQKWKGLAREAMEENGSSSKNLKDFLEEVGGC